MRGPTCRSALFLVASAAALAAALSQDSSAGMTEHEECAATDASCHVEDDDLLEVSLLQTSLRLQHEEAVMRAAAAAAPAPPPSAPPPTPHPRAAAAPSQKTSAAAVSAASAPQPGEGQLSSSEIVVKPHAGPSLPRQPAATAAANASLAIGELHDLLQANASLAASPPPKATADPRLLSAGAVPPAAHSDSWIRYRSLTGVSSIVGQALNAAYDPTHKVLDGVPLMLICMLGFMIGLVFIVQVVGWAAMGEKDQHEEYIRRPRSSLAHRPGMMPTGAFPVPQSERGSFASASPQSQGWQTGTHMAPMTGPIAGPGTSRSMAQPSPAQSILRSAESVARPDAICPALILPHGEAQFSIPLESISSLNEGHYPVQILGPSGRPLLHARLPTVAEGGGPRPGRWLELSTTPRSRYPHACVGPLPIGALQNEVVEIHGPRGDAYGTLEWRGTDWAAKRAGRIVLLVERSASGGLAAASASGGHIAQALPDMDADLVRVQVSPGVDALLTLLCMMAVMLMTPEAAGLPS